MNTAELRRLAEAAIGAKAIAKEDMTKINQYYMALERFENAANPAAMNELLDENELLKKANSELATAAIEKPPYKQDILARLTAAEAVCYSLFSDCCEWQVDVDALKAWKEKYEEIYLDEYERKAKEGSMDE